MNDNYYILERGNIKLCNKEKELKNLKQHITEKTKTIIVDDLYYNADKENVKVISTYNITFLEDELTIDNLSDILGVEVINNVRSNTLTTKRIVELYNGIEGLKTNIETLEFYDVEGHPFLRVHYPEIKLDFEHDFEIIDRTFGYLTREDVELYYKNFKGDVNRLKEIIFIVKDGYLLGKYVLIPLPNFERVRRITGYLVGTLDRFNDAKKAEVKDRITHS